MKTILLLIVACLLTGCTCQQRVRWGLGDGCNKSPVVGKPQS